MEYNPIKQRPYLCTAACIEMIFDRRNIEHDTQENIACSLGLIVPEEKSSLYACATVSNTRPKSGWGTQVQKDEYSINNYFLTQYTPN